MVTDFKIGQDLPEESGILYPAYACQRLSLPQIVPRASLGGTIGPGNRFSFNLKMPGRAKNVGWVLGVFDVLVVFLFLPDLPRYHLDIPNVEYSMAICTTSYFLGKYLLGWPWDDPIEAGGSYATKGRVALTIHLFFFAFLFFHTCLVVLSNIGVDKAILYEGAY